MSSTTDVSGKTVLSAGTVSRAVNVAPPSVLRSIRNSSSVSTESVHVRSICPAEYTAARSVGATGSVTTLASLLKFEQPALLHASTR